MERIRGRWGRVAAGALVLLLVAVAGGGLLTVAWNDQIEAAHRTQLDDLRVIADLKRRQVQDWREERKLDAGWLAGPLAFREAVASVVADETAIADPAAAATVREQLRLYANGLTYLDAVLVGPDGRVLSTASGAPLQLDFDTLRLIASSKQVDGPAIGPPYLDAEGHIRIWIAAPVRDPSGRRIATVLLAGDPSRKLFNDVLAGADLASDSPATGDRPEPVEALLVTVDGEDLVLLSPSQLDGRSGVGTRLDLKAVKDPTIRDTLTIKDGEFEGIDAFPDAVLAQVRSVADSDWRIITRVRLDDVTANAGVGAGSLLVRLVIAALAALLVVAGFFLVRQRRLLRRITEAEHEGRMATERFDQTMARTREIVLLVDADGRIQDANPAAVRAYGYDPDTLRTMRIGDLRVEGERSRLGADLAAAVLPGGTIHETVHQRADGSTFPVEVRTRAIAVDDALHYEGVVRDISERVAAERAIRRQLDELRRWQAGTIGREERILGLKAEVNDLLVEAGRPPRYASAAEGAPEHAA